MKRFLSVFVFLFSLALSARAQQDDALFGNVDKPKVKQGFVITMNGNFDLPAADMADRFGTSYRIGPSVWYKTKDNWIFGVKFDFINGSIIREDSFLINIYKEGGVLNQDGFRTGLNVYERGYDVCLQGGKILNVFGSTAGGLLLLTSAGFIQHKIRVYDSDETVTPILGDYRKGYDRLANGILLEQLVGYNYFSPNNLFSFYVGFNFSAGFTQGRRDFLFDVKRPDTDSRVDILYGIRAGLHIPIFKRKSDEIYFK